MDSRTGISSVLTRVFAGIALIDSATGTDKRTDVTVIYCLASDHADGVCSASRVSREAGDISGTGAG